MEANPFNPTNAKALLQNETLVSLVKLANFPPAQEKKILDKIPEMDMGERMEFFLNLRQICLLNGEMYKAVKQISGQYPGR